MWGNHPYANIDHRAVEHTHRYSHKHFNAHRHSSNSHTNVYTNDYTYGYAANCHTDKYSGGNFHGDCNFGSNCNTYRLHAAIPGCA